MKTGFWPTWPGMQPAGFAQFSGNAEVSITGRSHRGRNLHLYQASSEDDKLFQRPQIVTSNAVSPVKYGKIRRFGAKELRILFS